MSITYLFYTIHHLYYCSFQDKYPKDGLQSPVRSAGDNVIRYPDDAAHDILIIGTSNGQSKEKLEGAENPGVSIQGEFAFIIATQFIKRK